MKFINVYFTGYLLLSLTFQNTYIQTACLDVTFDKGAPSELNFVITSPDEKYIILNTGHEVSLYNLTDLAVHVGSLVASAIRRPYAIVNQRSLADSETNRPNGMTIATRSIGIGMWLLLVTEAASVKVYAVNTSEEKVNMMRIYLAIQLSRMH